MKNTPQSITLAIIAIFTILTLTGTAFAGWWPTMMTISLDSPKNPVSVTPGEIISIRWTTTGASPQDRILISMKRDSVPESVTVPDNVNWYRFTEHCSDNSDDGEETVVVPLGLTQASDWRFYVGYDGINIWDPSETFQLDPQQAVYYSITATAGNNGTISPSCTVIKEEGTEQTFAMIPDEGYAVSDVMVNGESMGAVTSYTFKEVTADHTIYVIYEYADSYTITATAGTHGSISPSGVIEVTEGEDQTFTMTPDDGYAVSDVVFDHISVGALPRFTFSNVTVDHIIHVTYRQVDSYTITATAGSHGTISPSGVIEVTGGGSQTFTMTPDDGYAVSDVLLNGMLMGQTMSYTFVDITWNHTIDVYFEEKLSLPGLAVSIDPAAGGTVTGTGISCPGDCTKNYSPGTTVQLTASPADCYEFAEWSGACSGTSPECSLTINSAKSVTANFTPKTYSLSITADNGSVIRDPYSLSYNCGTVVSLTATPDSGYNFDHWEGDISGGQADTTVTISDNMAITAVFVPKDEPGISVRPSSLEIYENTEDRSQAFYAQNVASAASVDEKSKGLVIPHTVEKYWRSRKPRLSYSRADLTKSEDWSVNDSPVKNQGSCGSCWAFAAAALIENLGNKDDLAEQVLVSCISESNGCSGGWYGYALDHIHNKGLPPEDCYPYIAQNGNCGTQCSSPSFVVKVEEHDTYGRWGVPDQDTVSNLKYLLQTGPVLVSMRVPTDGTFNKYQDGIYDYDGGAVPENRGHAVLAVGYDDDGQYFKVKNSWGPWWGEGGYFRIAYNDVTDHVQFGGYACTASGAYTAEEGDEDTLAFTIENTGVAALSVLLSCDKTWLTYAPQTTFFVYPGEQEEVSVSVSDWSKVAKPEETATISVSSNDPDNPLVIVTVRAVPKTETTGHGVVSGQVITNVAGHPVNVAGATVTIQGRSAVSDAAGKYTIVNVPDGTHEVRFESDHLGSVTESVTVTQGQISIMPAVSLSCPSQSVVINMQDTDGDDMIGLAEAIRALQIVAGIIK